MKQLFPFAILFVFILGSCKKQEKTLTYSEQLNQTQALIEEHRYDEATDKINNILQLYGPTDRALAIKASILIRKTGINLKEYVQLEGILARETKKSSSLIQIEALPENLHEQVEKINKTYSTVQDFKSRIDDVPLISTDGAKNISQALQILEQLKNPSKGLFLYRAFVKVFYFKYLWESGYLLKLPQVKLCEAPILQILTHFRFTKYIILSTLQDLALGLPQENIELKMTVMNLNQEFQNVEKFLLEISEHSDTLLQYLKSEAKTNNKISELMCSS